jgi:ferredoxin
MPHQVDMETCTSCGLCLKVCPNKAVSHKGKIFMIDPKKCKDCVDAFDSPQCVDVCQSGSCIPIPA